MYRPEVSVASPPPFCSGISGADPTLPALLATESKVLLEATAANAQTPRPTLRLPLRLEAQAVAWYRRLGYDQEWEHRFEPGFSAFVSIARKGEARIVLSEHNGDAVADGLIYLRVRDIEPFAVEFDVAIDEQPWGREVQLVDLDGNRLRVGASAQSG